MSIDWHFICDPSFGLLIKKNKYYLITCLFIVTYKIKQRKCSVEPLNCDVTHSDPVISPTYETSLFIKPSVWDRLPAFPQPNDAPSWHQRLLPYMEGCGRLICSSLTSATDMTLVVWGEPRGRHNLVILPAPFKLSEIIFFRLAQTSEG